MSAHKNETSAAAETEAKKLKTNMTVSSLTTNHKYTHVYSLTSIINKNTTKKRKKKNHLGKPNYHLDLIAEVKIQHCNHSGLFWEVPFPRLKKTKNKKKTKRIPKNSDLLPEVVLQHKRFLLTLRLRVRPRCSRGRPGWAGLGCGRGNSFPSNKLHICPREVTFFLSATWEGVNFI